MKTLELVWRDIGEFYQRKLSTEVIAMYADTSRDLGMSEQDVLFAFRSYRQCPDSTRFPLPALLAEYSGHVQSVDSLAREYASSIVSAITALGPHKAEDAAKMFEGACWEVVQSYGGWSQLCALYGRGKIEPTTFLAQARESLKPWVREQIKRDILIKNKKRRLELQQRQRKAIQHEV